MAGYEDEQERRGIERHYRRGALAHPVRQGILRLLLDGMEASAVEIAAELNEAPSRIAYHLLVLTRRKALKGVARDRPAAPCFRLAPQALWARKMLIELDREDGQDESGGRD